MDTISSNKFQYLHLVLGIFFIVAGILTLFKADFLYSIWIISLGLLFLFDILQNRFLSRFKPASLKMIHYFIALIVLILGVLTLFK